MRTATAAAVLLAVLGAPSAARADDACYRVPLNKLKITEGQLPGRVDSNDWRTQDLRAALRGYAVLDGAGEAYVVDGEAPLGVLRGEPGLAVRAPGGQAVRGLLFLPKPELDGMVRVRFEIAPGQADPQALKAFAAVRADYYRRLLARDVPGAAWFRHQLLASGAEPPVAAAPARQGDDELDRTYNLFTGGRAISENLQLDRTLRAIEAGSEAVDVATISSIDVREIDWKPLIRGAQVEPDPLARCIPADQHGLLFASFSAMNELIDEADAHGTPILQWLEPRSEDALTGPRYERQLCLSRSALSRLLGPRLVRGAAFTGSDPYLRTGTDVAVLFDASNPGTLRGYVEARQAAAAQADPAAKLFRGQIAGVDYQAVRSPDRAVCSYLAAVGDVVIVTNSPVQLERVIKTAQGKSPALAGLDEYTFFRSRYRRGDPAETALLVLSDATIRRWCGPRWRIGDSRRTLAAAVLSELQARYLPQIAAGQAAEKKLESPWPLPAGGTFRLTPAGVVSDVYGTADFLTPIAELDLDRVTRAEADAYGRWRDTYQRNWRNYFDPIAVRFRVSPKKVAVDVTVWPLILGSDYREFSELTAGAKFAPDAGDRHAESLWHFIMAIDPDSEPIRGLGGLLGVDMAPVPGLPGPPPHPLSWLGGSISLFMDDDPFWAEAAKADDPEKFLEKNFHRLPIGARFEVRSGARLTVFLAGLRTWIDRVAPGMTRWEPLEHQGRRYVRITFAEERANPTDPDDPINKLAICYAPSGDSLLVTVNEVLLKRALDRATPATQPDAPAPEGHASSWPGPRADPTKRVEAPNAMNRVWRPLPPTEAHPWLGGSLALQVNGRALAAVQALFGKTYRRQMQIQSWSNIPILNEWKRMFPDADPVELHERLWGVRLVCPGGGRYVWNEQWRTMESSVCGHPGQPKPGPAMPDPLKDVTFASFGVTFERGVGPPSRTGAPGSTGLEAHAELERAGH